MVHYFYEDTDDIAQREALYKGNPRSKYYHLTKPTVNPGDLHPYFKTSGWHGALQSTNPVRWERLAVCI